MFTESAQRACKEVINLDKAIRFAGISNGAEHVHEYRQGVVPLLTLEETELTMFQALVRMSTRFRLEAKLGDCEYVAAFYKKVNRISIPLRPPIVSTNAVMMISTEKDAQIEPVLAKVLKFVSNCSIK